MAIKSDEYLPLKDFRVEIDDKQQTFSVCFWLYLSSATTFPATLIQVHSGAAGSSPLLVIRENKKLRLYLMGLLPRKAPDQCGSASLSKVPYIDVWGQFPMEKWVHVGWEVSSDFIRLHIDGEDVGNKDISSLFKKDFISTGLLNISLAFCGGDGNNVQGYVHHPNVLPLTSSILEYFAKDPPVQLSFDNSSVSGIEEVSNGIWSIVGGKASCHRIFSLDVVLLDAFSHTVNKELEVIAFLEYYNNGAHVDKTSDGEPPLLAIHDGIEFASCDRPSKVVKGRASFKLKISQLSSNCDNQLFRIIFQIPNWEKYPFLKAFTPPIRCISPSHNAVVSSIMLGRSPYEPLNVYQPLGLNDKALELQNISAPEEKLNPSPKRLKLGGDRMSADISALGQLERCNSQFRTGNQVENACVKNAVRITSSVEEVDDSQSNSENPEARNSTLKSTSSSRIPMSDVTIFKYCLAGLSEKSLILKEIATSASNEELQDFAQQVSLYSGCSHHRHQIIMAKRLVEEGTKAWKLISPNNDQVQWESAVFKIEEQFMKIACCNFSSLTKQDFELLKRIAGCKDYLAQENFEKMWCWLYPVALTLSKDGINTMWSSTSPKWIEGFITKEEAEFSIQPSRGFQEPGTFVLRFPTSRSWPHPDAGSLVVTYLGSKCTIHHKLISLDNIASSEETNAKPLQDMLLAEPELSRLGRIIRSH